MIDYQTDLFPATPESRFTPEGGGNAEQLKIPLGLLISKARAK